MPPLPPASPTLEAQYSCLLSHLPTSPSSSPQDQIPEIDILPSSTHGTSLLYTPSPPCLGIPRSLLLKLYLHALQIFSSSSLSSVRENPEPSSKNKEDARPIDEETARLDATTVMLLWDPNHVSAINHRKRFLVSYLKPTPEPTMTIYNGEKKDPEGAAADKKKMFESAVEQELKLLETLLTSPLPKHTKSSTLWTHRLWLLTLTGLSPHQRHPSPSTLKINNPGTRAEAEEEAAEKNTWLHELDLVLRAGERHPRNYYAWQYARDLSAELKGGQEGMVLRRRMTVEKVYRWCLAHPRDISGWSFLAFLLCDGGGGGGGDGGRGEGGDGSVGGNTAAAAAEDLKRIAHETKEFVRKYDCKGESIDWFLNALDHRLG